MPNKELQLYSCEYVMDTALKKTPFIVDRLLAPGLYILAGAPKVGKSWLVLDLCLSVSEGRDFLGHRTTKGQVVYLALEDSLIRLQNRVYEFTDEPTENLDFALLANTIGNGLENQLEAVKEQKPDLKLIVIDTLQKVRSSTDTEVSALPQRSRRRGGECAHKYAGAEEGQGHRYYGMSEGNKTRAGERLPPELVSKHSVW